MKPWAFFFLEIFELGKKVGHEAGHEILMKWVCVPFRRISATLFG
jgi:hypothetical protein